MKKTLKTLFCAILLIVTVLSMAACGKDGTQKQLDDLQAKLVQQQEQLQQLEELLKQQQAKNEKLELQYSALVENIQKLQASIDRLENPVAYSVIAVAGGYVHPDLKTSYVIYTQTQLQQFFDDLDAECDGIYVDTWYFMTDDGTKIDKDYFNEAAANFNSKALVVSIFVSPCVEATVTGHSLWKNADVLHVGIEYTHGTLTAIETVMVIMEVDRNDVEDISEAVLALNK